MTEAMGAAKGGGWTANSCWVSMGMAGTAKLPWGATDAAAMVPGAGTMAGAGNIGRE